jgi:hypothetical protein
MRITVMAAVAALCRLERESSPPETGLTIQWHGHVFVSHYPSTYCFPLDPNAKLLDLGLQCNVMGGLTPEGMHVQVLTERSNMIGTNQRANEWAITSRSDNVVCASSAVSMESVYFVRQL